MRLIGAILLFTACTLFGAYCSFGLSQRVRKLEFARNYIKDVSDGMRATRAELCDILAKTEGEVYIKDNVWHGTDGLEKGDIAVLDSYLSRLGKSDIVSQLKNADEHIITLERRLTAARERKNRCSRLYVSLGFFCGMFAAIVIV